MAFLNIKTERGTQETEPSQTETATVVSAQTAGTQSSKPDKRNEREKKLDSSNQAPTTNLQG